eukprot:766842-Hanusia_phi.AAC.6
MFQRFEVEPTMQCLPLDRVQRGREGESIRVHVLAMAVDHAAQFRRVCSRAMQNEERSPLKHAC